MPVPPHNPVPPANPAVPAPIPEPVPLPPGRPDDLPAPPSPTAPATAAPDDTACLRRLEKLGAKAEPQAPIVNGLCGAAKPVRLTELPDGLGLQPAAILTCQAAEALARWSTEVRVRGERDFGAPPRTIRISTSYEWVETVVVDGGYKKRFIDAVRSGLKRAVEVILRPQGSKGFVLLPKRWLVEQSIGALTGSRRLKTDYETLLHVSAGAMLFASVGRLLASMTIRINDYGLTLS